MEEKKENKSYNELIFKPNSSINKVEELEAQDIVQKTIKDNSIGNFDVKTAIDLKTTAVAVSKQETVDQLVQKKTDELLNDAEAKKIQSETDRINKEVEKVKKQAEKEIAEYNKLIEASKKEAEKMQADIEQLKEQDNKANQFFESNKSILKCIGVREKLSLRAMQLLMIPAAIVYTIFQILLLPFSLLGFAIEAIMNIVDAVCGKISKAGWKIVLSIAVVLVIVALAIGAYWLFVNVVQGNL